MVPRSVSLALSAAALCLAGSMTAAQVTPLTIDLTNHDALNDVRQWVGP